MSLVTWLCLPCWTPVLWSLYSSPRLWLPTTWATACTHLNHFRTSVDSHRSHPILQYRTAQKLRDSLQQAWALWWASCDGCQVSIQPLLCRIEGRKRGRKNSLEAKINTEYMCPPFFPRLSPRQGTGILAARPSHTLLELAQGSPRLIVGRA